MKDDSKKPEKGLYRKVEVRTWGDERFCRLSALPPSGQSLWLFFLTGPHTGSLPGLFRAGRLSMSEDLEWLPERFDESFQELSREGMAKADWKARVVWIPNAIKHNPPANPNVVKSWKLQFDLIPECPLKHEAWETLSKAVSAMGQGFADAFSASLKKPSGNPSANRSGNPSANGIGNQLTGAGTGTGTGTGTGETPLSLSTPTAPIDDRDPIAEIFAYWQKRMNSPRSALDDKRRKIIKTALKNYSPTDLCRAIRGCSLTPHNMGTSAEGNGQKYNGIDLIFRNSDQIDRFIANDATPPRANGHSGAGGIAAHNEAIVAAFLAGDTQPSDDHMTVDMEH